MVNNIPDLLNLRKSKDIIVILMIIMLGIVSFELGRLSVEKNDAPTAKLHYTSKTTASTKITKNKYVASKTGRVYHLPWCSGAGRIKNENKIWFASKKEAESAGYRPASNCKGI